MNQENMARLRKKASLVYQNAWIRAAKVPLTGWVVGGFVCFAALLMALHTVMVAKDATLRLKVQHGLSPKRKRLKSLPLSS